MTRYRVTGWPVPAGSLPKARSNAEYKEQAALIKWARNPLVLKKYPELDLLSCSLNGVKLSKAQAYKAKAAGMLKGEHDLRLPVARGDYIGLSLELKAGDNKPTDEQIWYGFRLEQEGWLVRYCWSCAEAQEAIEFYLSLPRKRAA